MMTEIIDLLRAGDGYAILILLAVMWWRLDRRIWSLSTKVTVLETLVTNDLSHRIEKLEGSLESTSKE